MRFGCKSAGEEKSMQNVIWADTYKVEEPSGNPSMVVEVDDFGFVRRLRKQKKSIFPHSCRKFWRTTGFTFRPV